MSKPSEAFEQAYDNFLAGCDVDTTILDCAEFMFNAGRESVGKQAEPVAFMYHDGPTLDQIPSDMMGTICFSRKRLFHCRNETPLYTHPAQPVQPAGAQGNQRTIIQDARVESSILSRAMEHPTVLEIMAACAEIIDTESSAVLGADYDGIALRATAKRFLEQAKQIRKSDPEIWEDCFVAELTHTTPAAAINEQLFSALESCVDYGSSAWDDWLIDKARAAIAAAEAEKARGRG